MLSMSKPLNPQRAAWYFERDHYYLTQEGEWYGGLSDELGLSGVIQREDFLKLLNGFNHDGNKLVASAGAKDILNDDGSIKKNGHRSGIDLTFSAPKSVSILSYQDPRINQAFNKALNNTLDYIEKEFAHTQTKDRAGVVHAEKTDKLLWSKFVHDTSRELDPQLHCHCVLMNITQNQDRIFKTLHNDALYKNKMFLGQHFRGQLAEEIRALGYKINVSDRKKGFFEIKGVGDDVIQAFSKRSAQVRDEMKSLRELKFKDISKSHLTEWAKERKKQYIDSPDYNEILNNEIEYLSKCSDKVYENFSDAKLAAIATTNSRVSKKDVSREYITSVIESTCNALNTSLSELQKSSLNIAEDKKNRVSAQDILKDVIAGFTEGQSTFSKYEIINECLKFGIGTYTFKDFEGKFTRMLKSGSIHLLGSIETKAGINNVFSSKEMIAIENSVVQICKKSKGISNINVDSNVTDEFISNTDINLKMKSALELNEKDPVKSDYKFKSVLSKIDDKNIKSQLINLREEYLKAKKGKTASLIDAVNYPNLHQYFEKFGKGFTPGQKDALKLIASTKDAFSVIQGDAGTGKSYACRYAKRLLEQNGMIVRGFAPTGKATTGLAASAELDDSNYSTVDSFLLQLKKADPAYRSKLYTKGKEVWVIDEAGMCGSKKFLDLMIAAKEAKAKVIFIGDRKQFQSIEAGRMFSELQDKAGIDMVIMPDVIRQNTAQTKAIVKAISLKDMDFAFNVMQGYKKASDIVDKADIKIYQIGSIIQFTTGYNNLSNDTQCKVCGILNNTLLLEYFDDETRSFKKFSFNPSEIDPKGFDIYKPPLNHHILSKYSISDQLTLTIPEQGIPSNTLLSVSSISEDSLVVTFKDSQTGDILTSNFDPTKNPDNIKHLNSFGNEKLASNKELYENMITVESDSAKCLNLVAQDYLASVSARKDVLLITGTNKDKDSLNQIIRPELVKQGLITDSKEFNVFQTKSLAGITAMTADSYKIGQVIITNNIIGQVSRGTQCEIVDIDKNSNTLKVRYYDQETNRYNTTDFDVRKAFKKFNTYDQLKKEFGVGDLILFLKNDKKVVGVNNGDTARILSIDNEGNVVARIESSEDKKEVSFNINNRGSKPYNYVNHAYAITDYKSQGATTSRLLWHAPTKVGQMSSNTFYVAITRCKDEVGVYTDDIDKLKEIVKKEQHKESTLDFTKVNNSNSKKSHDSVVLSKIGSSTIEEEKKDDKKAASKIVETIHDLYSSITNSLRLSSSNRDKAIDTKDEKSVSIDI